nr:hypothetical protein [Kitasatospora sp. RG8]
MARIFRNSVSASRSLPCCPAVHASRLRLASVAGWSNPKTAARPSQAVRNIASASLHRFSRPATRPRAW